MKEMTPEEFMHNHPKGMNICYWMLVTMNDRDLKSTQAAFEEYHQTKLKEIGVLANVMPSAYIMKLDRETTIVIAENIADAMDKAEESGAQDYEMSHCRTIPILH